MEEVTSRVNSKSLYEVIRELRTQKMQFSRLLYAGRLNSEDRLSRIDIGEETEKWIFENGKDEFTGIQLSIAQHFIHILEASSTEALYDLLGWLQKLNETDHPPFSALNVLALTEDNPTRLYGFWAQKTLTAQASNEEMSHIRAEEKAWEVYNNMCMIGQKVSQVLGTKVNTGSALASALKSTATDLIPSPELLAALCSDRFPALEDFLVMYQGPITVVQDNELIWPTPPELEF